MMNTSCINAKAPIQKQGEYSSGHSRKYCNTVESALLHCKICLSETKKGRINLLNFFFSFCESYIGISSYHSCHQCSRKRSNQVHLRIEILTCWWSKDFQTNLVFSCSKLNLQTISRRKRRFYFYYFVLSQVYLISCWLESWRYI
jgi:hypothetical protein